MSYSVELTRTIAYADGLMQRVGRGSARQELKGWSSDVKKYARATLRTETLVCELQEQVERGASVTLSWARDRARILQD